jgi:hypothetical protein
MLENNSLRSCNLRLALVAGFFATAIAPFTMFGQSQGSLGAVKATPVTVGRPTTYQREKVTQKAARRYALFSGVDTLTVKLTEAGEVARFSYRVLDPEKAKALSEKKNQPSLIDPRAGVRLVVPELPFVGQMRQSAPPEAGKSYWVAFSNKGGKVKRGDRVSVLIGGFHADGLMVE